MATYGDMRDAYSSIYEKKEEKWPSINDPDAPHKKIKETPVKRYPTGFQPTNVKEALDVLLDSGIITEEELDLLEMRKQDKVAGVKPGGSDNPLVRAIAKKKKEMAGGQQKKHIPGDKKRHTEVKKGPSPLQMQQVKRARQKSYKDMLHSPRD
jgi:hypothetical protein